MCPTGTWQTPHHITSPRTSMTPVTYQIRTMKVKQTHLEIGKLSFEVLNGSHGCVSWLVPCLQMERQQEQSHWFHFQSQKTSENKHTDGCRFRGIYVRAKEGKKGSAVENCRIRGQKAAAPRPKKPDLRNCKSKKSVISKTQFGKIQKYSEKFGKWPNAQIRLCSEIFGIIRIPNL